MTAEHISATAVRCFLLLGFFLLPCASSFSQNPVPDKTLLVHYMPWYASKPISGKWGWHWTMNHFNPDRIDADGHREIASHLYPLVGPYDSTDPHLLEYQTLLMKFSGIDGVIVDWYGIKDFNDYAFIHRCTLALLPYLKKAGLSFAVCYEDQTIKHMLDGGGLTGSQTIPHGQDVMKWLETNWFDEDWYIKIDNRPIMLVFGPQYYQNIQWIRLFSVLKQKPYFFTLNTALPVADGFFGWPAPQAVTPQNPLAWKPILENQYEQAEQGTPVMGTVFPQFHDIYKEAGVGEGYGHIGDQNGETFRQTLEMGLNSKAGILQLVTWNDYGEGTVIEPTKEFGFRYLEDLQAYRKQSRGSVFAFASADLRLPGELYRLRKAFPTAQDQASLNEIANLLYASQINEASNRIRLFNENHETQIREFSHY